MKFLIQFVLTASFAFPLYAEPIRREGSPPADVSSERLPSVRQVEGPGLAVMVPLGVGLAGSAGFLWFVNVVSPNPADTEVAFAIVTVGGAAIGSAACLVGQFGTYGDSFLSRFANCLASPLRAFNANPRDRMYLTKIASCDSGQIAVRLASASGRHERREFHTTDGHLDRIMVIDEVRDDLGRAVTLELLVQSGSIVSGRSDFGGQIQSQLSSEQLPGLAPLLADFDFYRRACEGKSVRKKQRGFDEITPAKVHLDAVRSTQSH